MTGFFVWLGAQIWSAAGAAQEFGGATLVSFWNWLKREVGVFWGLVLIVATLAWQVMTFIGDIVIAAFNAGAAFAGGSWHTGIGSADAPGSLANILAIANTFYPLNETLRYAAAMILFVWLPLGIYKLIKSWIPTLSGS